jgi:hypothetical protein
MKTADVELLDTLGTKDTKGRQRLGEARWDELLAHYENSGLTQSEYCRREGVNKNTFVAKLMQRRRNASKGQTRAGKFIEAHIPTHMMGAVYSMELQFPGGVIVRCSEVAVAMALLAATGGAR